MIHNPLVGDMSGGGDGGVQLQGCIKGCDLFVADISKNAVYFVSKPVTK